MLGQAIARQPILCDQLHLYQWRACSCVHHQALNPELSDVTVARGADPHRALKELHLALPLREGAQNASLLEVGTSSD